MIASKEKNTLRKRLVTDRLGLSQKEVTQYSGKILNMLIKHMDWDKVKSLHTYLPIKGTNEIDTSILLDFLRQNYPGIKIEIAPKKAGAEVPNGESYDLVVVPLLGFDWRGFRLGYGGGYYDRLLAKNRCKRIIGLAYGFSEVKKIPDEPHDQKLQTIITEEEVISAS